MAVQAGAMRETVEIIEMEDVPLAYYPGNTNRVKDQGRRQPARLITVPCARVRFPYLRQTPHLYHTSGAFQHWG